MTTLAQFIANDTPKFTKEIAEGFCYHRIEGALDYITDHVRYNCLEKNETNLRYLGPRVLSPEEAVEEVFRRSTNTPFDLSETSFYLTEHRFEYDCSDRLFERNLLINVPFMYPGNEIRILGRKITLQPTKTNKVISIGENEVFVSTQKAKYKALRMNYLITEDGQSRNITVIHSPLYINPPKPLDDTTKAKTTFMHYLLSFFGYSETMKMLLGYIPVPSYDDPEDPSKVVFGSSGNKPRTNLSHVDMYEPNKIKFIVDRKDLTPDASYVIGNVLYILDHFSGEKGTRPYFSITQLDDYRKWQKILGDIIFSGNHGISFLMNKTDTHKAGLLEEFDIKVKRDLIDIAKGVDINNQRDLLIHIFRNFNTWMVDGGSQGIFHNKTIEAETFILEPTTHNFNRLLMEVVKEEREKDGKALTHDNVEKIFRKTRLMQNDNIYKLRSAKLIAASIEDPTDHLYFKRTVRVVFQESNPVNVDAGGSNTSAKSSISAEVACTGSVLNLPKKNPTGSVRINPYLRFDPRTLTIVPPEGLEEIIARTDALLSRSTYDPRITDSSRLEVEENEFDDIDGDDAYDGDDDLSQSDD